MPTSPPVDGAPRRRGSRSIAAALVALLALGAAAGCADDAPSAAPSTTVPTNDGTTGEGPASTTTTTAPKGRVPRLHAVVTAEGATAEELVVVAGVVRKRLAAAGIVDADTVVVGREIVIDTVADLAPAELLELVGGQGQLSLRPVLAALPVCPTTLGPLALAAEGPLALRNPALGCVLVGPGVAIELSAAAAVVVGGQWAVTATATPAGLAQVNVVAAPCFARAASCPAGRLAMVVDDVIESQTTPLDASYLDPNVQVLGGFDGLEGQRLAALLSAGAPVWPIRVIEPPVTVERLVDGTRGAPGPATTISIHYGPNDGVPRSDLERVGNALRGERQMLGIASSQLTADEQRRALTILVVGPTDPAAVVATVSRALSLRDPTRVLVQPAVVVSS